MAIEGGASVVKRQEKKKRVSGAKGKRKTKTRFVGRPLRKKKGACSGKRNRKTGGNAGNMAWKFLIFGEPSRLQENNRREAEPIISKSRSDQDPNSVGPKENRTPEKKWMIANGGKPGMGTARIEKGESHDRKRKTHLKLLENEDIADQPETLISEPAPKRTNQ